MAGMAIKNWSVSVLDFTWVVHDNDLSLEEVGVLGWNIPGIRSNITSLDISDGETIDVEANIVSWNGLSDLLVMHLN